MFFSDWNILLFLIGIFPFFLTGIFFFYLEYFPSSNSNIFLFLIGILPFSNWIFSIQDLLFITIHIMSNVFFQLLTLSFFLLFRYFLVTSNYFFYGESLIDYFGVLINSSELLPHLVKYHRFISFTM